MKRDLLTQAQMAQGKLQPSKEVLRSENLSGRREHVLKLVGERHIAFAEGFAQPHCDSRADVRGSADHPIAARSQGGCG